LIAPKLTGHPMRLHSTAHSARNTLVGDEPMHTFEEIKPGARLRGLDPAGIAEVVSVSKFGNDAINLVFRVEMRWPARQPIQQ
jgi:hypothetical protein